jgi:hypothetical protein
MIAIVTGPRLSSPTAASPARSSPPNTSAAISPVFTSSSRLK